MSSPLLTGLSLLVYSENALFIDTVYYGYVTIKRDQSGSGFNDGTYKFKTVDDVVGFCGDVISVRLYDIDPYEKTNV